MSFFKGNRSFGTKHSAKSQNRASAENIQNIFVMFVRNLSRLKFLLGPELLVKIEESKNHLNEIGTVEAHLMVHGNLDMGNPEYREQWEQYENMARNRACYVLGSLFDTLEEEMEKISAELENRSGKKAMQVFMDTINKGIQIVRSFIRHERG